MNTSDLPHPRIGVGVFVWKDGKFIMGQRQGAHGAGSWSIPGGHLEFGESWEECARRETKEETGLDIKNVRFLAATNDIFPEEKKHYVTIWVESDWAGGEATITEPDKFVGLAWRDFESLPEPLFLTWNQLKLARPELFAVAA
jgi:8-oxo-dGTP diphosphatase